MNRNAVRSLAVILFAISSSLLKSPAADQGHKLADIYRTGHARLVAEATLDMNSMPGDVYLGMVSDLDVDDRGNVYVLDYKNCDIKIFDGNGKFLKVIGRKGQGPGEFSRPSNIAVIGDRLVVYDWGASNICELDLEGRFLKSIPWRRDLGMIKGISALPGGEFILENERVYFEPPGKPQDRGLIVMDAGLEQKKEVYARPVLSDMYSLKSGNIPQPFHPDIHWGVSAKGLIAIGFSEKYEIEMHDPVKGKLSAFTHVWKPVVVTSDDKKKWFDGMTCGVVSNDKIVSGKVPDSVVAATSFPDNKPAFDRIFFDREGNVLVHPVTRENEALVFDAFTPQGKFISRVRFTTPDPNFKAGMKIVADCSWYSNRMEEDGNWTVTRWRITE